MHRTIKVLQPGFLTTVQDLGRYGYSNIGMPEAGVMDEYAMRIGNILLENNENAPVLELTLVGPVLEFQHPTMFVITGGDLQSRLNQNPIEMWRVLQAQPGDMLSFAGVAAGCRSYLAVAGGFDVPLIMGSASTYLRGRIGGFCGRALHSGDVLAVGNSSCPALDADLQLAGEYLPVYGDTIRVILGPQDDTFTHKGIDTLLSSVYVVSNEADRMGCRLDGPAIEHLGSADIISDGIALGAIQVPAHGRPIIMLADHQTTGGYTKIAHVISVDIPNLAQKKPGDRVLFQRISVEEAQQLYRKRENRITRLKTLLQKNLESRGGVVRYTLVINERMYSAQVEEL
jgi:biotin-dependent carboxylase-like uncharacterized protein